MWPNVTHGKGNNFIDSAGSALENQKCLFSQNGHFFLKCQEDGKIVLYKAHEPLSTEKAQAYWQSSEKEAKNAPYKLCAQGDGNLVLYDKGNKPIWASQTSGKQNAPYTCTVQYDGNLTLSDKSGQIIWEAKTQPNFVQQPKVRSHVLENDFNLLNESTIFSPNGLYFAKMQGDGKLAVYQSKYPYATNNATFKWQNTAEQHADGPFRLAMQGDGNLVIYNAQNKPNWASNVQDKHRPFSLHMQDDGNLVVYDKDNKPKWAIK